MKKKKLQLKLLWKVKEMFVSVDSGSASDDFGYRHYF